ncbi:hypothetical protein M0534_06025 [Methylonatrum kenyense]|uniref:hypothetical protein n=1 Tax=Methylonatrum kenyense TaxID=455253 RepID=UPI0020C03835|nr:hypothetical protein [Methylonatrum kenyense]MCK8515882.1 hypothetical protein [Methylonatrum kenyense]
MLRTLIFALLLSLPLLVQAEVDAETKLATVEDALDDREVLARLTPLEAQEVRTLHMQAEQHLASDNVSDAERDLDRALETLGKD